MFKILIVFSMGLSTPSVSSTCLSFDSKEHADLAYKKLEPGRFGHGVTVTATKLY